MYAIWSDELGYWMGGTLKHTLSIDIQAVIERAKRADKNFPMHSLRVMEVDGSTAKRQVYDTKRD